MAGGKRAGAGRPRKIKPEVVIPRERASLPKASKHRLTTRLMDHVMAMDITPLEVMLNTMKLHYDSAQTALKARDEGASASIKEELLRKAKTSMGESCAAAEKIAPYLHAKLQAVTIKGDKENPLNVAVDLRGLSDAELATMQALMIKAYGGA